MSGSSFNMWSRSRRLPRGLALGVLACALLARPARAADTDPEVGRLLARAAEAAERADALERQARQQLLSSTGEGSAAIERLQQMEEAHAEAEAQFRAALKADPQHPLALAAFGRFLIARNRFSEAAVCLDRALESARSAEAFLAPERADLYRTLGGALERSGQTRPAVLRYRKAQELNGADARNGISLAVALCVLGELDEAVRTLDKLLAVPALPEAQRALALYTKGYAREEAGEPEEALALYRDASAHSKLAGVSDSAGAGEVARMAMRRVQRQLHGFRLQPLARERYKEAAHMTKLGDELRRAALLDAEAFAKARSELFKLEGEARLEPFEREPLRSFQEAQVYYQLAIETEPRYAPAQRELGLTHLALGQFEAARTHLEAAALYDPLSPQTLSALGEARMLLDDWEGAVEAFTKLMQVDPHYGPAHLGTARALAKLHRSPKDCTQALDALDRAQQLGVDPLLVRQLEKPVREALAALERGEKLPASARRFPRPGDEPAKAKPAEVFEPWKDSILDVPQGRKKN